jgi:CRISPR/Cas system CMR-associated protein Cmr5 small subunit
MRDFKGKNKHSSVMQSKPVLILLAGLVLFFAISLISFMSKLEETKKNEKLAGEKVIELQKQKTELSSDIDKLNTSQGTEDAIREKFGLGRDGEGVIVVVDDKTPPPDPIKKSSSIFSFFTKWFK